METEPRLINKAGPQSPVRAGFFVRLAGTVLAPAPTFREVAAKPEWARPVLLVIALTVATTALLQWRVPPDVEGFVRSRAQQQGIRLTPEQIEQNVKVNQALQRFLPAVEASTTAASMFLVAAALWGILSLLNSRTRFGPVMAVSSYAWAATGAAYSLLFVLVLLVRDPQAIGPQGREYVVASNLAAVLPKSSALLVTVAKSLDLFTLWYLALLSVGVAQVTARSVRRAALIVFSLWGGWLVTRVALVLLGVAF